MHTDNESDFYKKRSTAKTDFTVRTLAPSDSLIDILNEKFSHHIKQSMKIGSVKKAISRFENRVQSTDH